MGGGTPGGSGGSTATATTGAGGGAGAGGQAVGSGGAGGGVDAGCFGDEEICAPWWDTAWPRRRRILVDLANATALVDFPVLVRLEPERIDYAATTPGGGDVRFVSEDGSVIRHDVDVRG